MAAVVTVAIVVAIVVTIVVTIVEIVVTIAVAIPAVTKPSFATSPNQLISVIYSIKSFHGNQ